MRANDEEYARPAPVPETSSLSEVRAASCECTACHLYKHATQTVFGEGPKGAPIMLVGEQPGDYDDVAGKPFVGPAGKIMDQALEEAGIDRSHVYVTNAVKHFNGSRGASVESTRNQTPAKSQLAGHGLRRSCVW